MQIDLSTITASQVYHLMTQTVIPRPVAWVLTDSGEASYNLAPFSYFTAVSSRPPLLMLSVGKKPDGTIKDTTRNVLETGKLVIHIAGVESAEAVTATSAVLEHGDSEVTANNIELENFDGFALPRVKQCPVAFACHLYQVQEMGEVPQSLIFAEVVQIYVDEQVIDLSSERLKIDAKKISPLARLGGIEYAGLDQPFSVARPK